MKKYFILLLLIISVFIANAQFQPAIIPENPTPVGPNDCSRAEFTSCYSFRNVYFPSASSNNDLYVYSWSSRSFTLDGGIGWKRTMPNGGVLNEGYITLPSSIDINVALIESNNAIIIIAAYFKEGIGYVLDYYKWGLTDIVLISQEVLLQTNEYHGIKLDAHRLYAYSVIWSDGSKVFLRAGRTDVNPFLACTVVLDQNIQCHNPDIAIGHGDGIGSGLTLHMVYTSNDNQRVFEAKLDFDEVHSNCQPMMIPIIEDSRIGSNFGYPRIDCPDHFDTDDWSYVVNDNNVVYASVMAHQINSSPQHFILNDGSLGNLDISSYPNSVPVVAYDVAGHFIYYAWHLNYPTSFFGGNDNGYIGVKLRNDGGLANNDYWLMQVNPQFTSGLPSIALSKQNDQSNNLYTIFTTGSPSASYQISYKNIPWNLNSFRPDLTNMEDVNNFNEGLNVAPNPFIDYFQLSSTNKDDKQYNLLLSDISGKNLLNLEGNISSLNEELLVIGNKLSSGMYFLKLNDNHQNKSFKIIKQ